MPSIAMDLSMWKRPNMRVAISLDIQLTHIIDTTYIGWLIHKWQIEENEQVVTTPNCSGNAT